MRLFMLIAVISFSIVGLATIWADSPPAATPAPGRVTLLGNLAEWKYPGSKMPQGASMSDGGNPLLQSVNCQAVLTTADAVEKVVEFYSKKLGISPTTGLKNDEAEVKPTDAKSVSVQEDSQGRPVVLRIISVNKGETSTTLVISRAQGEKETHIAWSQYLRLDGKR